MLEEDNEKILRRGRKPDHIDKTEHQNAEKIKEQTSEEQIMAPTEVLDPAQEHAEGKEEHQIQASLNSPKTKETKEKFNMKLQTEWKHINRRMVYDKGLKNQRLKQIQ